MIKELHSFFERCRRTFFHNKHFSSQIKEFQTTFNLILQYIFFTANVDLMKMVQIEILLNLGNYFRTLQLGNFEKKFQELCFFITMHAL